MKKSVQRKSQLFLLICFLSLSFFQSTVFATADYYRIAILGDPHLPFSTERFNDPVKQEKVFATKLKVRNDINSWDDVALVAVVGDIVAESGSTLEYDSAKQYFADFSAPIMPVTGNHDFVYADRQTSSGKLIRGDSSSRGLKLERFREAFGLKHLSYTKELGPYLLVFLSLESDNPAFLLAQYSPEQLQWLREQLQKQPDKPTLIFSHPPLKDTLLPYNKSANTPSFYAQPHHEIHQLLADYPQIFLWVSGHTHTPPNNVNFHSENNLFDGRVWNIHNTDMDRETIWTRSLYLYPDKVVVRTFNHRTGQWLDDVERIITRSR